MNIPMPPMPNECHPYFENRRELILQWLINSEDNNLILPIFRESAAKWVGMPSPLTQELTPIKEPYSTKLILSRKTVFSIAPFVGKPFVYMWYAAVDQYKRYITTGCHIKYINGYVYRGQVYLGTGCPDCGSMELCIHDKIRENLI